MYVLAWCTTRLSQFVSLAWGFKKVILSFSGFSIVPHPDWVLQVGVEYDVSVQIYSQDNHKVYITDVRIFFSPLIYVYLMQAQVSKIYFTYK